MSKKYFVLILLELITFPLFNKVFAQSAGINFSLAFPINEFKDKVDNVGFGISGEFLLITPKVQSPFGIGVNAGYFIYGMESRREPFSLTIPDVFVNVDRTNNLVNFHLLFQIGLPAGRIRPYVEGLFGGSYLYTETNIKSDYNNNEVASSVNFDDWAWSYGFGGGIGILVAGDPVTNFGAVYIDLKGRYLFGSEAKYLKEGSVEIIGSRVTYLISESKTDIITAHAGIRAYFEF